MREALKNLFSNQISLEDSSQFYYTIKSYEMTNTLGNVIALLQEYCFTEKSGNYRAFSCKLYKTKEGNWYDIDEANEGVEKSILLALKLAVDNIEGVSNDREL